MKIAILGSEGRQGKALHKALDRLEGIGDMIGLLDHKRGCDQNDLERAVRSDFDLVISCLPYSENIFYGELCIKAGNRWADLGGHVNSNRFLNGLASERECVIATDLGLAPGLVEYLGFKLLEEAEPKPESIRIMCGGLPQEHKTRFGYQVVFSPEGLVNNYVDECEVLRSGEMSSVYPMEDNDNIYHAGVSLETGNSSGGTTWKFLKTMKELGVVDCRYQTLRYPGHWEMALDAWYRYKEAPTDAEAREDMTNWIKRHATEEGPDVVFLGIMVNSQITYSARIDAADGLTL